MHKIRESGRFLGRLWGSLLKNGLPLMKNLLKPLGKSVLISLWLTTAVSATDADIHKKMFGSGMTTLIISHEEMNDIMKIVKSLEESGLLIKDVSETIKNKVKEQKGEFISILLGTLGASLLGNLLIDKGTIGAGKGTVRAGQAEFLMSSHLLINFEKQKYYQNEPKFNGVYSCTNWPKIKDDTYVIILDEFKSIKTHWIALCVNSNNIICFDSLESNIFQMKFKNS